MRIVDANVLLYAVNEDALHHDSSRTWLDAALSGGDTVGFTWVALLAFVRLSTKQGLFAEPLSHEEAMRQVSAWTTAPGGLVVDPGPTHVATVSEALRDVGHGGNLVNDAHLAAIAIENRADIVSYDNDFSRFSGVRWYSPDQLLQ